MALGKIISIKNVGRFLGWSYTSRRLFQKYAIEFDVAVSFHSRSIGFAIGPGQLFGQIEDTF